GRPTVPMWSRAAHRLFGVADAYFATEMEANRQAVRLGDSQVTGAHLMLAVVSVADQLDRAGVDLAEDPIGGRSAAAALRACGLSYSDLALAAAQIDPVARPDAPRSAQRGWRADPKGPPWTVTASGIAERARTAAEPGAVAMVRAGVAEDVAAPELVRRS